MSAAQFEQKCFLQKRSEICCELFLLSDLAMSEKIIHAVLEGLDQAQSKGGLIIRKKPPAEAEKSDGGFKLPSGPSLLGLDKLAVVKERERKMKEAETARKRQLEEGESDRDAGDKFAKRNERREKERQLREPRVETPSYTGGVSEEAVRREEERRRREDRGLKAEKKRDRDRDYYDREWRRDDRRDRDRLVLTRHEDLQNRYILQREREGVKRFNDNKSSL